MKEKSKKPRIRNSAKAVIIRDGKLLLQQCDFGDHEICYLFPGGGQHFEETLTEAVERECMEELGAKVEARELVWIREYISKNHEFAAEGAAHQVEFYFRCALLSDPDPDKATHPDRVQIDTLWVPIKDTAQINLYPKTLGLKIGLDGKFFPPIYAGDVN